MTDSWPVAVAAVCLVVMLMSALPRRRKPQPDDDGFVFWPPCPECGNIAVSCIGRSPANAVPAKEYTLACDHGVNASGVRPRAAWPGSGYCGCTFTMTHAAICSMQPDLEKVRT